MKRPYFLLLLPCLLLSGCSALPSLPRPHEPRSVAIVSVLGVDTNQDMLTLSAAAEARNSGEPVRYHGESETLFGAVMETRPEGMETVNYSHVEHILLGAKAAEQELSRVLSFGFREAEQSTETNLWVLRDAEAETALLGEADPVKRMNTLKVSAEVEGILRLRSIREVAAQLADEGAVMIPALRWNGETLVFDGYALYRQERLVGYVEAELARSAVLLQGGTVIWAEEDVEQHAALQLRSTRCAVSPMFQNGILSGLRVDCHLQGKLTEQWSEFRKDQLCRTLETQTRKELESAMQLFQDLDADCVNLRRRAGSHAPWRWNKLTTQWKFADLPCQVTVSVTLTEA